MPVISVNATITSFLQHPIDNAAMLFGRTRANDQSGKMPDMGTEPKGTPAKDALIHIVPFAMVFLWSTGFIGTKLSLPFGEPFSLLFWRFATTSIVLAGMCWATKVSWPKSWGSIGAAALTGIFLHAAFLSGSYLSVNRGVPTGIVALIVALHPIVTAVLARPLFGEPITTRQLGGLLLGFGGVGLVVSGKLSIGTHSFYGAGYALLSLVGMTTGTLLQKRFGAGVDLLSGMAVQFAAATLVMAVMTLFFETTSVRWTGEFVLVHLWLVFGCSIGAVGLTYLLIRANAISRVASLFYLIAPLAAVMGFIVFDERLGITGIIGMAIAVTGVALVTARFSETVGRD